MPKLNYQHDHDHESTTALLGGMVADARDLALVHLEQMQREIRADLGNLGDALKVRALALAAFMVGAILFGGALALALARLTGLPPWASLGIVAGVILIISVVALKRTGPRADAMDLIPEDSLAAAKRDAVAVSRSITG